MDQFIDHSYVMDHLVYSWLWLIPAAISAITGIVGMRQQKKANEELAKFQASANEKYLQQQLEYNTPANQMQRYQDAGLNPNLIYGQGNPGSQSQPLSYPDIKPTDMQQALQQLGPIINQSMLAQSQVQVNDARIRKTGFDIQLNKLQQAVLAANPLLDKNYFDGLVRSMLATAESKEAESGMKGLEYSFYRTPVKGEYGENMMEQKLWQEYDNLVQRFNLGTADQKLKAEVLQSKEFQNAIAEIQVNFMKNAEFTPEHVRQFIMMVISSFLR